MTPLRSSTPQGQRQARRSISADHFATTIGPENMPPPPALRIRRPPERFDPTFSTARTVACLRFRIDPGWRCCEAEMLEAS
jgi:hypothetical protein